MAITEALRTKTIHHFNISEEESSFSLDSHDLGFHPELILSTIEGKPSIALPLIYASALSLYAELADEQGSNILSRNTNDRANMYNNEFAPLLLRILDTNTEFNDDELRQAITLLILNRKFYSSNLAISNPEQSFGGLIDGVFKIAKIIREKNLVVNADDLFDHVYDIRLDNDMDIVLPQIDIVEIQRINPLEQIIGDKRFLIEFRNYGTKVLLVDADNYEGVINAIKGNDLRNDFIATILVILLKRKGALDSDKIQDQDLTSVIREYAPLIKEFVRSYAEFYVSTKPGYEQKMEMLRSYFNDKFNIDLNVIELESFIRLVAATTSLKGNDEAQIRRAKLLEEPSTLQYVYLDPLGQEKTLDLKMCEYSILDIPSEQTAGIALACIMSTLHRISTEELIKNAEGNIYFTDKGLNHADLIALTDYEISCLSVLASEISRGTINEDDINIIVTGFLYQLLPRIAETMGMNIMDGDIINEDYLNHPEFVKLIKILVNLFSANKDFSHHTGQGIRIQHPEFVYDMEIEQPEITLVDLSSGPLTRRLNSPRVLEAQEEKARKEGELLAGMSQRTKTRVLETRRKETGILV